MSRQVLFGYLVKGETYERSFGKAGDGARYAGYRNP